MSCFQLALAPEGRCKQTCLYNRVLISKDDSNIYLIRFTFEKDEDQRIGILCGFVAVATEWLIASLFFECFEWIGFYVWRETSEQGGY